VTRTGALVWKEWRDHRAAVFVFAALVPLVSWPVQRWIFKFGEPNWTWAWIIPICVGLAVAVVAADSFAMDIATSRMASFAALPVPLRRHFGARTLFLGLAALAIAAWTAATNLAIVGWWGKPDAVALHLGAYYAAGISLLMTAAATGAVLVFSSLGVGGFRAVLGGAVLAGTAFFATDYASDRLFPHSKFTQYWSHPSYFPAVDWTVVLIVLFGAAYAGFVGGRAHAASRKRGAACVAGILVAAFALPAGVTAWKANRSWMISPTDPEVQIEWPIASPDGRYVAVCGTTNGTFGGRRCWIVRVDDGKLFDWPRRDEFVYGWSKDGYAWIDRNREGPSGDDRGRLARTETGETVCNVVKSDVGSRVRYDHFGADWAQSFRFECDPSKTPKDAPKGVYAWTLWSKDSEKTKRVVVARQIPAPTPNVGQVLIATAENKLALVDLAGGEPRIVADDAVGLRGALASSRDGRFYTVTTSKGEAVLDAATWKRVAGPFGTAAAIWCGVANGPSVLAVYETKEWRLERLVNVATGREVVPDATLGIRGGYGAVQAFSDGRFVFQATGNRVLLLDPDGKLIRRLFPPEE
jgi:hypothetical protein